MRLLKSLIFAVVLTIGFASTAQAGAKAGSKTSTVTGTFVGYQEHNHTKKLVISVANDTGQIEEQSIKLDDSTKITLDGQTIAATAFRGGEKVTITLTKKIATQITATSR